MKSRIGELIGFLDNARKRGAILKGKSAFERELNSLINAPSKVVEVAPELQLVKPQVLELSQNPADEALIRLIIRSIHGI